ncbi:hypothetical protein GCM10029992_18700 [Glycomyces albus]
MRAKAGGATALQQEDFDAAVASVRPSAMAGDSVELGGLTLDDVGGMTELKQTLTETVLWPLTYPDAFTRLGIEAPRASSSTGPLGAGRPTSCARWPGRATRTSCPSRARSC